MTTPTVVVVEDADVVTLKGICVWEDGVAVMFTLPN